MIFLCFTMCFINFSYQATCGAETCDRAPKKYDNPVLCKNFEIARRVWPQFMWILVFYSMRFLFPKSVHQFLRNDKKQKFVLINNCHKGIRETEIWTLVILSYTNVNLLAKKISGKWFYLQLKVFWTSIQCGFIFYNQDCGCWRNNKGNVFF